MLSDTHILYVDEAVDLRVALERVSADLEASQNALKAAEQEISSLHDEVGPWSARFR